jgi:phosphatidylinositol-3-phosphatase
MRATRMGGFRRMVGPCVLALGLAGIVAVAPGDARSGPVPRLQHVVVVVFENRERPAVVGAADAPAFTAYAHRYVDLTRYYAVAHPSLPNYLALVSGSTHGITSDCTDCAVSGPSIGTLLDRAGLSWGAYAEGYADSPSFAKKHVPFLYFQRQADHVHPLTAFDPARLPRFAFVVPDLCSDGHDCSTGEADRFLAGFVPPLLQLPRTAIFVVFDEGTSDEGGGGHVAALVLGTAVRRRAVSAQRTDHYGLLRTIEDALGLPHLGASARVRPLSGIWR